MLRLSLSPLVTPRSVEALLALAAVPGHGADAAVLADTGTSLGGKQEICVLYFVDTVALSHPVSAVPSAEPVRTGADPAVEANPAVGALGKTRNCEEGRETSSSLFAQ